LFPTEWNHPQHQRHESCPIHPGKAPSQFSPSEPHAKSDMCHSLHVRASWLPRLVLCTTTGFLLSSLPLSFGTGVLGEAGSC
jgi:hypothetical protein